MFGSQVPASTPAGGFSFGQQANTPATAKPNLTLQMPTASTSLFGQQPQQQQQKPGFGFAAPAANAPTTSTFGATQTANQPQPSLFGQAQQPNPSLFGQATQQPSTSLFGQSQQ